MSEESSLIATMQAAEQRERLDTFVKQILSHRVCLAELLAGTLDEFRGMKRDDVESCIAPEPEVGSHPLDSSAEATRRTRSSRIIGDNTEDAAPDAGTIVYDLRFKTLAPKGDGLYLIVNVESENNHSKRGYPLLKRAMYYSGRLISAQKSVEFEGQHYERLHKVVSCWVCLERGRSESSIERYRMAQTDDSGLVLNLPARPDLIEIVFLNVGDGDDVPGEPRILAFLRTLLREGEDARSKQEKLRTVYDIHNIELEEELANMCNYSDFVYDKGVERGIEQGRAELIRSAMSRTKRTLAEVLESLGIPSEELPTYEHLLAATA